jgi:hypothetical protein
MQHIEVKKAEHITVCYAYGRYGVFDLIVFKVQIIPGLDPHKSGNFGYGFPDIQSHGRGGPCGLRLIGEGKLQPANGFPFAEKFVITQFIADIVHDQDKNTDPDGQSQNIYNGQPLIPEQIPERGFKGIIHISAYVSCIARP